ncbi:MAG: tetratricopeptide repeat protein [Candidatus Firestonebacteria bacterium]
MFIVIIGKKMKKVKLILISVFMLLIVFSCKNSQQHSVNDNKAIKSKNEKINKNKGNNLSEYQHQYDLGYNYLIKKEYDKAIYTLTKAIGLYPTNIAYYDRGNAYYYKGEIDKAIDDFNKSIEIEKNFYPPFIGRGNAYFCKGQYDKAISDYTFVTHCIDDEMIYFARGIAYKRIGKNEKVGQDIKKAKEISMGFYSSMEGEVYVKKNIQIKDHIGFCSRGHYYAYIKEYDKAIADFNKAIELLPNYTYCYFLRGIAYEGKGEKEKAEKDFKKVEELKFNKQNKLPKPDVQNKCSCEWREFEKILKEKINQIGPEIFEEKIGNRLSSYFTPFEINCVKEFKSKVEELLLNYLQKQSDNAYGAIYILAYIKSRRALPLLRQQLLKDRFFYGWEGYDYKDEKAYLSDNQYPHHLAYIAAVEEITGLSIVKAINLSQEERENLEKDALLAKPDVSSTKYYCAKWLLLKLTSKK